MSAVAKRRSLVLVVVALAVAVSIVATWSLLRRGAPISPLATQPPTSHLAIESAALRRSVPVEWFVAGPDGVEPDVLLVLFHGRGGDERSWFGGSAGDGIGIAAIAERLVADGEIPPVLLASVAIEDSYGVDSEPAADGYDHGAYGRFLAEELLVALEAALPVQPAPRRVVVAGYSMGGYAALHLVLRDPSRYAGVGGLSTAAFLEWPDGRRWQIGGDPDDHDPVRLAASADVAGLRTYLGFADGDTAFAGANEAIARTLEGAGASVQLERIRGRHDVATWRALAPNMLRWLLGPPP